MYPIMSLKPRETPHDQPTPKPITPAEAYARLYPGALLHVRYRGTGRRPAEVKRIGRRGQLYIATCHPKTHRSSKERLLRPEEIVTILERLDHIPVVPDAR